MHKRTSVIASGLAGLGLVGSAYAQDWPMWGRTPSRNMSGPGGQTIITDFEPGEFIGASDEIDFSTSRNVKWIAKLGSQSYGNVTVADGRVYLGTNNDSPRDPKYTGDRSVV